ncbi:Pyridine nucleotide-disulfide oxidoreductase, FAD/NAD(P)-binding domain containing protein [Desulfovibrio sp. X2]|uniref:NAD(P)/FAD-dependent oxidoreductase n=1 Tax=Desulfovibrio sp. X2 TaxID=941449 RepID=UPI0003589BEB|nr:NAD(P)/FAD-dependent oxidoreductase [Desulfovibrio sp. X2]EPR41720.1 Pyridine nucleotide-disulfide oxidoreductase, FAD/NAD(P)-binding domain containing protein [Desulfovibrio sp. X2]
MSILDVAIIGGGPGGLACARRAMLKGLSCVVLEKGRHILQGIRDTYPKGKSVYPTVPKGAEDDYIISELRPEGEKEDLESYLCRIEAFVAEAGIPVRLGEEFLSLAKDRDGFTVTTSHGTVQARNVVLAFGSNIPVELGVYGEAKTVARSLENPEDFLGTPSLVLGGGSTAADIVAVLSRFKRDRGDETPVYWGHRRTTMRVQKDVARDMGEEILLGGNIKILHNAVPKLGEVDEEGIERLVIQTQRMALDGGVYLLQSLSFPMKNVIACIGSQGPAPVFRKLGLQMITCTEGICKIGKEGSELILLNHSLETSAKGVYAIGGAVSPVYMGVPEEGTITEQRHPNIIYVAVRDGVAVADEIAVECAACKE